MTRLHSNLSHASAGTLGQAGADKPKPRDRSPHNRVTPRVGARCRAGDHAHCYSMHCLCNCHEVKR